MRKPESKQAAQARARRELVDAALRSYGPQADVEHIDEVFAKEFRDAFRMRNKSNPKGWSYAAAKRWMGEPLEFTPIDKEDEE